VNQPPGYPPGYPPPGYGAPPQYGAPPPQGYAPQGYPPPGYGQMPYPQPMARIQHPKAMTAVYLGAAAWFTSFWLVLSIPAWVIGASALREIRANPDRYTGESEAKIGMWLGIVHTLLPIVILVPIVLLLALGVFASR
jgi:hypothetical protein